MLNSDFVNAEFLNVESSSPSCEPAQIVLGRWEIPLLIPATRFLLSRITQSSLKKRHGGFPGGLVVENLPVRAGVVALIPVQGSWKIPHAEEQPGPVRHKHRAQVLQLLKSRCLQRGRPLQ